MLGTQASTQRSTVAGPVARDDTQPRRLCTSCLQAESALFIGAIACVLGALVPPSHIGPVAHNVTITACSLKSDELWFWHSGCPINVIELVPPAESGGDAGVRSTVLGQQPTGPFTHRVPGGTVFGCFVPAAALAAASGAVLPPAWALVSCVVVPGFDFADWAMPGAPELLEEFRGAAAAAAVGLLSTGATQPAPPAALLSSPP